MSKTMINTKKRKILIAVGVVFILLLIGFGTLTVIGGAKDPKSEEQITVVVPQGSGSSYIAEILLDEGVIDSTFGFKVYSKLKFADDKMQAGSYQLSPSMSAGELVEKLKTGKTGGSMITIKEGTSIKEIAKVYEDNNITTQEAFLKAISEDVYDYDFLKDVPKTGETRLEGFLFPDTYQFAESTDPKTVVDAMLRGFDKAFDEEMEAKLKKSGKTILEIVTMASIVEEEAGLDADRPKVASVFYNRLEAGISLGSDVTVNYITGKIGEEPTAADLNVDSPYNTRKNTGLPPGPICSPGVASINGALEPDDTDFMFFVVKGKGTLEIVYTKTLEEHNRAVAAYRESFK